METYVTSLNSNAKVSHIGNEHRTACGIVFTSVFHVTTEPMRPVCALCLARTGTTATGTIVRRSTQAERDDAVVALLIAGHDNAGVARRLHIGMRTAVRWINEAQTRADARSRFQWGYKTGRAETGRG